MLHGVDQVEDRDYRGIVRLRGPWLQRALETRSLKGRHVGPRRLWPGGSARVQIGALAHGMALRIVLEQCDDGFRDGFWVVKRNQHASLFREQLFGVPARGGDNCIALGAGHAIISTPYWHAKGLLAEKRGVEIIALPAPSAMASVPETTCASCR